MGEYARRKHDEVEVKVGTCESMYYLRYTQRNDVVFRSPCPIDALWFRLPRPEENGTLAGDFAFHGYMGAKPLPIIFKTDEEGNTSAEVEAHAAEIKQYCLESQGISQVKNDKIGVVCNIPCYHGYTAELPKGMFYNGFRGNTLGVFAVGIREGEPSALIGCIVCQQLIYRVSLEELKEFYQPKYGEEATWESVISTLSLMSYDIERGYV